MKQIVVIGAGLGGLSAAVTLAARGYEVTVIEKNQHVGGKLMPIITDGHRFDFGPNTITMPDVFRSVIRNSGANPDDYFELIKLDQHTVNHYTDGSSFTFSADRAKLEVEVRRLTGDQLKHNQMRAYLDEAEKLFDIANKRFFTQMDTKLDPGLWADMVKVHPLQSLHALHKKYFKDPRIIQALDRYATYIGSSPYVTPGTFALIAHLELNEGVYFAKGGNWNIAKGFAKRASELGLTFRLGHEVTKIDVLNGKAHEVVVDDQEVISCDAVLLNGELLTQYPRLVDAKDRPSFPVPTRDTVEPSISAFVMMVGLSKRLNLAHHNVYFSDDYEREFKALFQEERYADEPTIYISNSSATDPSMGEAGDNLFILVNAPAHLTEIDADTYEHLIRRRLRMFGVDWEEKEVLYHKRVTPQDLTRDFYAYYGALYGTSANSKKGAFFRPAPRSTDVSNIWFAGGSTHPGGGSPMVTLSGQFAARSMLEDIPLTI
ncbi:Phytoene desaturase [Exiguobacterium sp. 8H]|uniref:phytoene desaturase family protein n=1 Tax=unclassified Exiguobacterium TaxID=2644629 RepID=UPI0012F1E14B|nr:MULTISPECIES: phytoene desaturase family protein [unclassified Exiguobacterium]VXA92068.1 Phytoene desaturase [Exiguobacterium sp. 8H]VXB88232.1 Phytoene desaturase [Exiguobacterium sp. 8A]